MKEPTLKDMLNADNKVVARLRKDSENLNRVVKSRKQAIKQGKQAENRQQAKADGQAT